MNKRIVYQDNNGKVIIIIPASNNIEEIVNMAVPLGSSYKIVDVSEIPTDRTFRDAWEWQD